MTKKIHSAISKSCFMSDEFEKKKIRKKNLKIRTELSFFEREQKSRRIQVKVINYLVDKRIKKLLSYANAYSEVETKAIHLYSLNNGIELAIPKVKNHRQMDFYSISNVDKDIIKGAFNIDEPIEDLAMLDYKKVKLALIPGVVFDLNGNRLGYGKGYYDYFLNQYPWIFRIGLAFECQLIEELLSEKHDQKMDMLITEENNYYF